MGTCCPVVLTAAVLYGRLIVCLRLLKKSTPCLAVPGAVKSGVFVNRLNGLMQVWEGQPKKYLEIMENPGFETVFKLANGAICYEHEDKDMPILTHISSINGCISCDDEQELKKIIAILDNNLDISISHVPNRLRAPKD